MLQEVKVIATTENLNIMLPVFIDSRHAVVNNKKKFYWLTMINQQVSKH